MPEDDPFARSGAMKRTPPRERSLSESVIDVDGPPEEPASSQWQPARASKKRKAPPTPQKAVDKDALDELREGLRKLMKIITEVESLAKAKNTKVEIKAAAVALGVHGREVMALSEAIPVYIQPAPLAPPVVSSQTKTRDDEEKRIADIHRRVDAASSPEERAQLAREKWPKATLRRARTVTTSITAEEDTRVVIICGDNAKDKAVLKRLEPQCRPIVSTAERLGAGKIAAFRNTADVYVEGEDSHEGATPSLLVLARVDEAGKLEQLVEVTSKALNALQGERRTKAAFYLPAGLNQGEAIRVLECCAAGTELEAIVCNQARDPGEGRAPMTGGSGQRSTAFVTVSGGTYADMLRKLKDGTNPEEEGFSVRNVVKTSTGELKLRIKETGQGGLQRFEGRVTSAGLKATVKTGGPETALVIRDLDETTTTEELESALSKALKDAKDAKVNAPRQGLSGGWSAFIRLPKAKAATLLALKRLQVGWLRCRVSEVLRPQCCYRCLGTGHLARDCKGEDRSKLCYRCGQDGHISRDCKADNNHCFICKVDGHYANSMACPTYKKQVEEVQTKAGRRKGAPAANPQQDVQGATGQPQQES